MRTPRLFSALLHGLIEGAAGDAQPRQRRNVRRKARAGLRHDAYVVPNADTRV
jgi:hypothetical protein